MNKSVINKIFIVENQFTNSYSIKQRKKKNDAWYNIYVERRYIYSLVWFGKSTLDEQNGNHQLKCYQKQNDEKCDKNGNNYYISTHICFSPLNVLFLIWYSNTI